MKQRPILMSGPLVREILAGNKTQTRRPIKDNDLMDMPNHWQLTGDGKLWNIEPWPHFEFDRKDNGHIHHIKSIYGKPGDQLWVKETYRVIYWNDMDADMGVEYRADGKKEYGKYLFSEESDPGGDKTISLIESLSDELLKKGCDQDEDGYFTWPSNDCPLNWKPSIFMPRGASRITLEIEEIRVERLHDISEENAKAEGVTPIQFDGNGYAESYIDGFFVKWIEIYGEESFDSNPWVFAITFKKIDQ